ncbi:MAG: GNAT family N-acetyltransferase [Oscillospiraceae bacterium]|jgi:ribosomal protein S18 acetylase RimI-like enzyme|nr:GNAT family N-acetyltransferase [Oscillospiraceae bacterium]
MTIRQIKITDYDAVLSLWRRTPGVGLNDIDDSRDGLSRYLERNPRTCFVAKGQGQNGIAGVIMSGHDGRRGFIYHTCVDEAYRGNKIGTRLVEAALGALSAEGISKTALVVFGSNELGNAFWESVGFTPRTDLVYRNKALTHMTGIDT